MHESTKRISIILKKLRKERGWSLDKTALETGVSKAMLGQIEREESSPTIATLWKIASGFNTSFSSFIEAVEDDGSVLHRSGLTQQLHPQDKQIRVSTIFPFDAGVGFEVFVIELLPGCEHLSPPHQEGVIEHIIVAEGIMEVLVDGEWRRLTQGEGLRFHANQPHGYRNVTNQPARIHDVIHYPQ